jgi:chemotaxis protein methyltransferase CheR
VTQANTVAGLQPISDGDFRKIRDWFYHRAGIHLSDRKQALVSGRLASRLRYHRLTRYGDYFELLRDGSHPDEPQVAIDLLTTNETSFFREPKHFEFLQEQIAPSSAPGRPLRVWSAACSSGEEPYSIGITLASCMGDKPWEILGSDLSSRILARARAAIYPMERAKALTRAQLVAHCLKGKDDYEGTFQVAPHVTSRVKFRQINLNGPLPAMGDFDVIFLRNVMIYFEGATKRQVIDRVLACLRPHGHLVIGHSESLSAVNSGAVKLVAPAIYQKH